MSLIQIVDTKFLGCYHDPNSGQFNNDLLLSDSSVSVDVCGSYCKNNNSSFFGLRNG